MLDVLKAGQQRAASLLAQVKKDQLSKPSPSYPVNELVNHLVGGQFMFASVAADGQMTGTGGDPPDFSAGDYVAAFGQGAEATYNAFSAPGAMEKMMKFPFDVPAMPGSAALGVVLVELFVHGWDLAKATGQDATIDPQVAAALLAGMKEGDVAEMARKQGFFAAEIFVADDATPSDKLVAFLGRNP